MKDIIVVKRYARAFLDFVRPTIGMARAAEEMRRFKMLVRENPDLEIFLKAYEISDQEKMKVAEDVLIDYSREFKDFLSLLLHKNRMDKVLDIADSVHELAEDGQEDALLRTTSILDTDILEKIKHKFEKITGKKLNFYVELDPDLLGGVQLMIGNKIVDGSVKKRLSDLRKKLSAAKAV